MPQAERRAVCRGRGLERRRRRGACGPPGCRDGGELRRLCRIMAFPDQVPLDIARRFQGLRRRPPRRRAARGNRLPRPDELARSERTLRVRPVRRRLSAAAGGDLPCRRLPVPRVLRRGTPRLQACRRSHEPHRPGLGLERRAPVLSRARFSRARPRGAAAARGPEGRAAPRPRRPRSRRASRAGERRDSGKSLPPRRRHELHALLRLGANKRGRRDPRRRGGRRDRGHARRGHDASAVGKERRGRSRTFLGHAPRAEAL
mmetsp:Transcript_22778/g.70443  ORF Transcript_22778/g.70443 Transcript_22778/m.70443 type:complete len:260 (+) Transcript_22778:219-998(+)